jgi:hypothetical protein
MQLAADEQPDVDLSDWVRFQEWIQTAEHRVTIPFAEELARIIPPIAVRQRRDFGSLLTLIRSHAILHQLNRDRDRQGRIVATLEDYGVVRKLVAGLMAENVGADRFPNRARDGRYRGSSR